MNRSAITSTFTVKCQRTTHTLMTYTLYNIWYSWLHYQAEHSPMTQRWLNDNYCSLPSIPKKISYTHVCVCMHACYDTLYLDTKQIWCTNKKLKQLSLEWSDDLIFAKHVPCGKIPIHWTIDGHCCHVTRCLTTACTFHPFDGMAVWEPHQQASAEKEKPKVIVSNCE